MKKIFERIYTGNQEDCFKEKENWAVVHACKFPSHINYLFKEDGDNL